LVEQIADCCLCEVVGSDVPGGQALGLEEGRDGLACVAALSVGASYVDHESDLALGREVRGVDALGHVEGFAGVA
jgi:hypothetical protein